MLVPLSSTTRGVLYYLTSIGFIALVDTTCKSFTDELHAVILVWGYFVGITVFVTVYFAIRGQLGLLKTERPVVQIVRPGFFGTLHFRLVCGADLPAHGGGHGHRLYRTIIHRCSVRAHARGASWLAPVAGSFGGAGRRLGDCAT